MCDDYSRKQWQAENEGRFLLYVRNLFQCCQLRCWRKLKLPSIFHFPSSCWDPLYTICNYPFFIRISYPLEIPGAMYTSYCAKQRDSNNSIINGWCRWNTGVHTFHAVLMNTQLWHQQWTEDCETLVHALCILFDGDVDLISRSYFYIILILYHSITSILLVAGNIHK